MLNFDRFTVNMVLRIFKMIATSGFLTALECTGRTPLEELSALPQTPLLKGPTSKGKGREGGGEGKGRGRLALFAHIPGSTSVIHKHARRSRFTLRKYCYNVEQQK